MKKILLNVALSASTIMAIVPFTVFPGNTVFASDGGKEPSALTSVVSVTVDKVVLPNLKAWKTEAKNFKQQTNSFCQQPSQTGLQTLRKTFIQLSHRWNQSLMFDFGPLRDNLFFPRVHFIESYRQRGKDYSNSIQSHLAKRMQDQVLLDEAYFRKLKFTQVGMPALEMMLYQSIESDSQDLLAEFNNPRKCQLLQGLAIYNQILATEVISGWTEPSLLKDEKRPMSYSQRFINNRLEDGEEPMTKLIFALQDYLRYINQRKLHGKLDAVLSGLSYDNMRSGLMAVKQTYIAGNHKPSMASYLDSKGKVEINQRVLTELDKAMIAIDKQDRESMKLYYSALIKLFEKEVPEALGLNLGMNFVDGD